MSLPDFSSNNAFATARLDRPDRALRKIAIKQMMGQQLNANELDRLARRQGVEARYEQFGNTNFGQMNSAYAAAGAPVMMRARLSSEGSALGRLAGEYGDGNIGGVQQLARERLLRERELGNLAVDNARWNAERRQENYDWAQELRDRQRRNWELADRRIADEESGRNALMGVVRDERQVGDTPTSLLAVEYRNGDGSANRNAVLENRIDEAALAGDYGAYSALNRELLSRQGAARAAADAERKREMDDLRIAKLNADADRRRNAKVDFIPAPDGSYLYTYGSQVGKLSGGGSGGRNPDGFESLPSKPIVVRDANGKIVEVIRPTIQKRIAGTLQTETATNPRYIEYLNGAVGSGQALQAGGGAAPAPTPQERAKKRGELVDRLF